MCDENGHVFLWSGGGSDAKMPMGIPCMCGKTFSKPLEENHSAKDNYQVLINENFEAVGEVEEITKRVREIGKDAVTKSNSSSTEVPMSEGYFGDNRIPEQSAVNHPSHYTAHPSGVECITIAEHFNFNIGNAIKYIWRAGLKTSTNKVEDLQKAVWYLKRELDRMEELAKTETKKE